jgi:hypothetical protein
MAAGWRIAADYSVTSGKSVVRKRTLSLMFLGLRGIEWVIFGLKARKKAGIAGGFCILKAAILA